MSKQFLGSVINRTFDDGVSTINRLTLRLSVHDDWQLIHTALADWELKGFVEVLRDPELAQDEDLCIKVIKYIQPD